MTYLSIGLGVLVLVVGGELLVRHSSRLAIGLGVSPLVVGLTVVAFGTSSPELISSVYGQWIGKGSLAVGNVVGSNIFNVLFILGLSAVVTPLLVNAKLLRIEVPVVLALSLLGFGFAYSGTISGIEAGLLLSILIGYTVWLVRSSNGQSPDETSDTEQTHWGISVGLIVLALALVVGGGQLFVTGSVQLARTFGIEESVIGLTIVAAGTSLPELVTSVLASLRGEGEIAVGNVLGSNIFNITGVLGLSGLVGAEALSVSDGLLNFDMPIMIATAVICLPIFFTGTRIDRWEGAVFMTYYVGYVVYLVLNATDHAATASFAHAMLWFVVPLTLLTLGVVGFRQFGATAAE
jgi:cation:H+ antiporter